MALATPAHSDISLGLDGGLSPNVICLYGTYVAVTSTKTDDCTDSFVKPTELTIGDTAGSHTSFNATTGEALFNAPATFNYSTRFNGNTSFSNSVSFSGTATTFGSNTYFTFPATFQANSTFNGAATFNGTANFTNGIATNSLTSTTISATTVNSGLAHTTRLEVGDALYVSNGANITMGNNQVHNVAAGTAATDAVNVAQLNAATAGLSSDVSDLQTTTATHTTEIADLQSGLAVTNTTVATHSTQISALQATTATQATQISALQAAESTLGSQVDTLFDLRSRDRRDMKQGVASAVAMANAPMPSPGHVGYAFNGAVFRGEYAVGGSLTYRLPGRTPFAVTAGFSYAGNKNNAARVGVAGEF